MASAESLVRYEAALQEGSASGNFREIVEATYQIVNLKLYKVTHLSVEQYFRERWTISRAQVYRWLDCKTIFSCLENGGFQVLPAHERQCRIMKKLTKGEQTPTIDLWRKVLEKYGNDASVITSVNIEHAWNSEDSRREVVGIKRKGRRHTVASLPTPEPYHCEDGPPITRASSFNGKRRKTIEIVDSFPLDGLYKSVLPLEEIPTPESFPHGDLQELKNSPEFRIQTEVPVLSPIALYASPGVKNVEGFFENQTTLKQESSSTLQSFHTLIDAQVFSNSPPVPATHHTDSSHLFPIESLTIPSPSVPLLIPSPFPQDAVLHYSPQPPPSHLDWEGFAHPPEF